MTDFTFVPGSDVLRYKADVLDDVDAFFPKPLLLKLGYSDASFQWDAFIAHLQRPAIQHRIVPLLRKPIPGSLLKAYEYLAPDAATLTRAIRAYLRDEYNRLSVLSSDVRGFVTNWKDRWSALTDTSVRDAVLELYKQMLRAGSKIRLRLIFGYHYPDHGRAAPETQLGNIFTSAKFLQNVNKAAQFSPLVRYRDSKPYDVNLHLAPTQVKRVKVMSGPTRNDSMWERFIQKYAGYVHNPNAVIVVDFETPLIKQPNTPKSDLVFGPDFLRRYKHEINRVGSAQGDFAYPLGGWWNLVQVGDWKTLPDYRRFSRGRYNE